jgi:NADPH:quinone reductase-like Zn-dependent oxidoreductase
MKAWMLEPVAQTLSLIERPLPEPGPQQVLVKVKAASLNRGEFLVGMGIGGGGTAAKASGMEAAGEVVALGAQVSEHAHRAIALGDRVMGRAPGGFAEYVLIDAQDILAVPETMDWLDAACVPIAYLVAYDMVVIGGEINPEQSCLITGVSSGVGVASMQIAHALGARVIGTSSSQQKLLRLKALGLQDGLLSEGPDFVDAVRSITGEGVALAINNVGGSVFDACLRSLRYQGRLALVGFVDGVKQSSIDLDSVHAQRLKIFGVSNKLRQADLRAQTVRGFAQDMLPRFASGELKPLIEGLYDFEDLPKAQKAMQSNTHLGKLVLKVAV